MALPWLSDIDRSPQMNQWHSWIPTLRILLSKNPILDFLSLALFIEYSLAKFLILNLRNSKLILGSSDSLKFDETLLIKSCISLMKVASLTREFIKFPMTRTSCTSIYKGFEF